MRNIRLSFDKPSIYIVHTHCLLMINSWCSAVIVKWYSALLYFFNNPDSKIHGANVGPTWALSAPDGRHVHCYQESLLIYAQTLPQLEGMYE